MGASRRRGAAIAADLIAIAIFATIGRLSHAEGVDVIGVLQTAWPFCAGWGVGLVFSRFWLRPAALSTGLVVWLCTVAGGMLLRATTGAGVQVSFVIVASIVLGLLLLGWRAISSLATRGARA